jgi:heptosyltransferase-2
LSRVLVIKLGYRNDLENVVSTDVSLASVLRSTVILNLFRDDEVVWLTSSASVPLIQGIPCVKKVLIYDSHVSLALSYDAFDVVVNLEPGWEFCALAESVNARLRFGFALDDSADNVVPLPGAERALALELFPARRRKETRPLQQVLYELMGKDWMGERYLLGYHPSGAEEFDIGFNMSVGKLAANKAWPLEYWRRLEELLFGRYSMSYEQRARDLRGTMEWLNSCRTIVTADTLGLYLALALGKKVVALFGPTSAACCHTYGRGIKLAPAVKLNCIPCCDTECRFAKSCVCTISPRQVADAVEVLTHADVVES